jgi:hypothetical protein
MIKLGNVTPCADDPIIPVRAQQKSSLLFSGILQPISFNILIFKQEQLDLIIQHKNKEHFVTNDPTKKFNQDYLIVFLCIHILNFLK